MKIIRANRVYISKKCNENNICKNDYNIFLSLSEMKVSKFWIFFRFDYYLNYTETNFLKIEKTFTFCISNFF